MCCSVNQIVDLHSSNKNQSWTFFCLPCQLIIISLRRSAFRAQRLQLKVYESLQNCINSNFQKIITTFLVHRFLMQSQDFHPHLQQHKYSTRMTSFWHPSTNQFLFLVLWHAFSYVCQPSTTHQPIWYNIVKKVSVGRLI